MTDSQVSHHILDELKDKAARYSAAEKELALLSTDRNAWKLAAKTFASYSDSLIDVIKEANEVCRSAYQIASRGGAETNWPPFADRLGAALERQHKILQEMPKLP